jgi:hypothetical protein
MEHGGRELLAEQEERRLAREAWKAANLAPPSKPLKKPDESNEVSSGGEHDEEGADDDNVSPCHFSNCHWTFSAAQNDDDDDEESTEGGPCKYQPELEQKFGITHCVSILNWWTGVTVACYLPFRCSVSNM